MVAECVLSGNTSVDRASLVSFLHSLEDRAGTVQQYSTVQYSTVQYRSGQYITVQYSADRMYSVRES